MKPKMNKSPARKKTKKTLPAPPKKEASLPVSQPIPPLSSINIAKILSGFLSFRSSVKDLRQSIQKIESMMDSAYQMFEVASKVMSQKSRGKSDFPSLPPGESPFSPFSVKETEKNPFPSFMDEEEDIPVIRLPEPPGPGPFSSFPGLPFLQNLNLQQIFSLISSPLVQRFITNLFKAKTATVSQRQTKRKQG